MRMHFWNDAIDAVYDDRPQQQPVVLQLHKAVRGYRLSKRCVLFTQRDSVGPSFTWFRRGQVAEADRQQPPGGAQRPVVRDGGRRRDLRRKFSLVRPLPNARDARLARRSCTDPFYWNSLFSARFR